MKKIALILCLVLVASFVLSGCNNSDSIITLEDREVGKIEIQSGNTGETVEVTEEEVISQIADILSLEFEKGEKSNDSTGWSYSVRWYDTEGKQIDTVVIMNDGTIEKDGYFWKTSKDNIELSVFDELVTKHSSELPLEWDKIPMVMVDGKLYCALPGFVDSKNEEKTERNAGYLVVSHSGGGMLRQGTRKGIRRTPANRGMRAHWVVKGLDISEDVCHGMCP